MEVNLRLEPMDAVFNLPMVSILVEDSNMGSFAQQRFRRKFQMHSTY